MSAAAAPPEVVLASASATRADLLRRAGIVASIEPAQVDEAGIKAGMRAEQARAEHVAETLAELKARRISARRPGALVIGADQMLECDDEWFDKPASLDEARATLRALRGRSHFLFTSAVVMLNGARIWHHTDRAELTVRPFSDAFLEGYLAALGDDAVQSVGCYRLEGLGAQLFTSVRGDFFTILGLPLLPLLAFLRMHGVGTE